tara:strand:- start:183 stop:551 length:369 start_codon:yes stop_codon:yes gene_type:complete
MKLGELIDLRVENKLAIDEANATLKELNRNKEELDYQCIRNLDEQGSTKGGNPSANIAIKEDIVPEVHDWDAFFEWLKETSNFEVLQRRLSSTACRELWAMGVVIPGVKQRELRKLSIRLLT